MKKVSLLLFTAAVVAASCNKKDSTNNNLTGTFESDAVTMFNGSAKTLVTLNNGVPQQLAISINDAAMNSLPSGGDDEYETNIPLSDKAGATAFDHVAVDWNPHGHEPAGVYTVPHFDFHFYMISKDEQMSIPAYTQDSTGFLNYPASQFMPEHYIPIPGGVPMMGAHWVDVTSPELHGAPFTQTFIYGSYTGKVIFYEPMITKAFLDSTSSFERTVPQPQSFQKDAYYPTKVKVQKHDGVTDIILDGFVNKTKAG